MRLAFILFKYFPFGGLQRDFLRIAQICQQRGHHIKVYTLSWQGDIPADFEVEIISVSALSNHKKYQKFYQSVQRRLKQDGIDKTIGFNKVPELDVYYAADGCFKEKAHQSRMRLYRLTPRYKLFQAFESSVFSSQSQTKILMISEQQKPFFIHHYQTQENRFALLPPGISRDRQRPDNANTIRKEFRHEFKLEDDETLLLLIGSGFKTKGLDRALLGLQNYIAENKKARFFVIGQDNPKQFQAEIKQLGLHNNVTIFSGRDDIPRFLLGADLLIHPAYHENTGTVLLEALVSGLPVITTDVCGYAHYIKEADAGVVISSPFQQKDFNRQLELAMKSQQQRLKWQENALKFAQTADIYSMPERAADIILNDNGAASYA